jgi:hypothetical protein
MNKKEQTKKFLESMGFEFPSKNKHWVQCTLCHCIPKPDEWSAQVQGVCIDCG